METIEVELTLQSVSALMFGYHKLKQPLTSHLGFSFSPHIHTQFTAVAQPQLLHINLHCTFIIMLPQTLTQAHTHNTRTHIYTSYLFSPALLFVVQPPPPSTPPFLPSTPLLILPSLVTAHCQQRRIRSI